MEAIPMASIEHGDTHHGLGNVNVTNKTKQTNYLPSS
jgi:hypothetical protein